MPPYQPIDSIVERAVAQNTGWVDVVDTQYTSESPFSLVANTDTVLPNNGQAGVYSQKPNDVDSFYADGKITGRNGDGLLVTIDCVIVPTSANTTSAEVWIDIGGAVGDLYRRIVTFPKGQGVARPLNFTFGGYTLDTWESNGGTVYIRANGGTADIYSIRYVLTRSHRARI